MLSITSQLGSTAQNVQRRKNARARGEDVLAGVVGDLVQWLEGV